MTNYCTKHKRKPKHLPNADCRACWKDYLSQNPKAQLNAGQIYRLIFDALSADVREWQVKEMWRKHHA